ncbi:hypothetical protein M975_3600 [Buttiauxella brennerae ATCC 51605]|uniref:Uncharacterized protein n=1 Tax=Buttiauxella brennerae ATCC 51605 TaxID=1354251 RepID=A0A1B7IHT1_9ENTR|nr:hypothetical protein [Buttiauxella brennerae]OAT28953.1 hypothetical protein M975_3600 [Buttiauxella brennerae ATCC 51605]
MKTRKAAYCWVLIVLLIALPLSLSWYQSYQKDHFSCDATTNIVGENISYDMITHLTFDNGSGTYSSLGILKEKGKPEINTNNNFSFKYWHEDGKIIMISGEHSELEKVFSQYFPQTPDFFIYRERGISLKMIRENVSSYLFSYDNTPLFYCILTNQK